MIRLNLIGATMLVLSFAMTGCGSDSEGEIEMAAELDIEDFEYVEESNGARILRGVLVNLGDSDISGAQVEVVLLDEQNRQVGTAHIQVDEIKAGERTNFRKVLDRDEEYARARVRSVLVL